MSRPLQRLLQVASCSTARRVQAARPTHCLPLPPHPGIARPFTSTSLRRAMQSPHPSFPDIEHNTVQVVDPETKSLGAPQSLTSLLRSINTEIEWPLLVSHDPPIVRIRNIEEHKKSERERQASKGGSRKADEKEVQIPWTIADGDLGRKIQTALGALEGGNRLTVVFAPKVGGGGKRKVLDPVRMAGIVRTFEESVGRAGKKWKDDETGPRMRSLFYAPLPELKKVAEKRFGEHLKEARNLRDEKKEARRRKDEERRRKSEEAKARGE